MILTSQQDHKRLLLSSILSGRTAFLSYVPSFGDQMYVLHNDLQKLCHLERISDIAIQGRMDDKHPELTARFVLLSVAFFRLLFEQCFATPEYPFQSGFVL